MSPAVVVSILLLLMALLRYGVLRRHIAEPLEIMHFGPTGEGRSLTKAERAVVFRAAVAQQRAAYTLFWGAVALGIALNALFWSRLLISRVIDAELVVRAIGSGGTIAFCLAAQRLYRITTGRLDRVLARFDGE